MIPNPSPCYHDRTLRDIVAWTDDGKPMAIDHHRGELVEVIGQITDDPKIIQLIPATGWHVTYNTDTDTEHTEPLVCWGLMTDGSVVPLTTDCHGIVAPATDCHDIRITPAGREN